MIIMMGSWFEGVKVRVEPCPCGRIIGVAVWPLFHCASCYVRVTGPSVLHSRLSIPREGVLSYLLLCLLSSPVHKKVPWDASRNILLNNQDRCSQYNLFCALLSIKTAYVSNIRFLSPWAECWWRHWMTN